VFGLIAVPLWALALLFNWGTSSQVTDQSGTTEGLSQTQVEQLRAAAESINIAANVYTSGQFLGVLIVMLLGAIVVTNEIFHQTATTTFLTTPRRESVILAKLAAAAILGLGFWAVTTALNLIFGSLVLSGLDVEPLLGEPAIWRAIGLNALAYGIWAIIGVGAGVLIRSQIGATITLTLVYIVGYFASGILFFLLVDKFGDGIGKLQVLVPPLASQLMISGSELPGNPPRWVGAVVLIGYALVTGVIGTLITKRRDVS
jgi:ABC-type transport system involved in multi-copper enzyme maturation permease subunit